MLKLNFNPYPVLQTPRLLLRQMNEKDVDEVFLLRSDPVVMKYIDRTPTVNKQDALDWIKNITKAEINNEAINWGITIKGADKLAGNICYWRIQNEHYRAEIGYSLLPQYHGKGIMQEAMEVVLDYGFKIMKLHSIEANVNPLNAASIKILVRNKFVKEAWFKENYFFDGKFLDSFIFSLVTPYPQQF